MQNDSAKTGIETKALLASSSLVWQNKGRFAVLRKPRNLFILLAFALAIATTWAIATNTGGNSVSAPRSFAPLSESPVTFNQMLASLKYHDPITGKVVSRAEIDRLLFEAGGGWYRFKDGTILTTPQYWEVWGSAAHRKIATMPDGRQFTAEEMNNMLRGVESLNLNTLRIPDSP